MKNLYLLSLLLLLSCTKKEETPQPDPFKQSIQGDWLPASEIEYTLYNSNNPGPVIVQQELWIRQYTFSGDSAIIYLAYPDTVLYDTYQTKTLDGVNYLTVRNNFTMQDKTEFKTVVEGNSMEWEVKYNRELYYNVEGHRFRTDSSKVNVRWIRE